MIEEIIRNYLIGALNVPVYLELPKTYPDKYLTIEKTGSGVTDFIKRSTFAIQSNAPTMYEAAELNERAKEAMDNAIELDEICRSHLESDYNYTDQSKKDYRYQAIYEIIHY